MSSLHAGGRTVLFVSHNLTAVENLCPRTIWMDKGRIRQEGESREVIQSYLATFADASCFRTDLTHIESRRGSGEVRFTAVEFLGSDGRPMDVIRSGDRVTIRLHYRAAERICEPHFGIEIHTKIGSVVTSINTWTSGFKIDSIGRGRGTSTSAWTR